jgi:hypothetical protein
LKAIVSVLKKKINIYTSDSDVIEMGSEFSENGILHLCFHKKYFSLGGIFNE